MAKFDVLYSKIEYNVKTALQEMTGLREENVRLKEEIQQIEEERRALRKQVEDMEYKMKLLVVTKTVLNKEDTKHTKKKINDWLREIDNCIALLKRERDGRE